MGTCGGIFFVFMILQVCLSGKAPVCPVGVLVFKCFVNPCDSAKCPAFPKAKCSPYYCGGCIAQFFVEGKVVTDQCAADRCSLPPDPGPCKGLCSRFYYNKKTETCEPFTYGCCGGNANNFETPQDCFKTCAGRTCKNINCGRNSPPCPTGYKCTVHPADAYAICCEASACPTGVPVSSCKADPCDSATCPNFPTAECTSNYCGGCFAHFFVNGKTVTDRCAADRCSLAPDPGPCDGLCSRFYYNDKTGICEPFTYGCCGGNANNFETPQDCFKICAGRACKNNINCGRLSSSPCPTGYTCTVHPADAYAICCEASSCPPGVPVSACKANPCDSVTCPAFPTAECRLNSCGGCFAQFLLNGKDVTDQCKADICSLAPDPGPCKGLCNRFYYKKKTGTCEPFTYGCCGGNANNFETPRDCFKICAGRTCKNNINCGRLSSSPCPTDYTCTVHPADAYAICCEASTCPPGLPVSACKANPCDSATCPAFPTAECRLNSCGGCFARFFVHGKDVTDQCRADICSLAPDPGPCEGLCSRFYYNKKTEICEPFTYGCCGGNANNFEKPQDCFKTCTGRTCTNINCGLASSSPCPSGYTCQVHPADAYAICCEASLCSSGLPDTTCKVNPCDTATCPAFPTAECRSNLCSDCSAHFFVHGKNVTDQCGADICSLAADPGPCRGACSRYYYDEKTGICEPFTYGCCGGNANNFETPQNCFKTCAGRTCTTKNCGLPTSPPCPAGYTCTVHPRDVYAICCEASICPPGVPVFNCFLNPCDTASCPAFLTAKCSPNYCGGCFAHFFVNGKNVTDECEVTGVQFCPGGGTQLANLNCGGFVGAQCPQNTGLSLKCQFLPSSDFGPCCVMNRVCRNDLFCGRGPTRENCPDGFECVVHPADRFAVCCEKTICPPGVQIVKCTVNPCDSATCPAFPTAKCRPNYCGGCFGHFFVNDKNVTDQCDIIGVEFCPKNGTQLANFTCGGFVGAQCPRYTGLHVECQYLPSSDFGPCCVTDRICRKDIFCGRGPSRTKCPDGFTCTQDPSDRFAVCCEVQNKPGRCPNVKGYGVCLEACDTDAQCPGNEKCCSNGCGHVCLQPQPKPGQCPRVRRVGTCKLGYGCTSDYNCPGDQKCCSNGCRDACTEPDICTLKPETGPCEALITRWFYNPVTKVCQTFTYGGCDGNKNNFENKLSCQQRCAEPKPGVCPHPRRVRGTCSKACESDFMCPGNQKCCRNRCGHACSYPGRRDTERY